MKLKTTSDRGIQVVKVISAIVLALNVILLVLAISDRDAIATPPEAQTSVEGIIAPDGARVCGICSGCGEVHFIWEDNDYHHHHGHVDCNTCDFDCHCHLPPELCDCGY